MTVTVTHPQTPFIDVTRGPYNARGDGVDDDTDAIQQAIDAGEAAGGGIVFFPTGEYAISSALIVPETVALVGAGMVASSIKATDASAKITADALSHVTWHDFRFDGNGLSTVGVEINTATGSNGGGMRNIRVRDCVGTNGALRLHNVQNGHFDNIEVTSSTSGLWVDDGCGSLVFTALKCNDNEYWQLKVGSSGAEASDYVHPTAITFIAPMLEWIAEAATANTVATVLITSGERIHMYNPILVAPHSGQTEPALAMATVAPGTVCQLQLVGGMLFGQTATTNLVTLGAASTLTFIGKNVLHDADVGIAVTSSGAFVEGDLPELSVVTAARSFAGGASEGQNVITNKSGQEYWMAQSVADRLFLQSVTGEAGIRHVRYANGKLGWHGGTGYVEDTNLYRVTAGGLKTDGRFHAGNGLGVGNSAAATTPGSVTKKIEVFDATTGASLGFLAVYNAIT